MEEVTGWLVEWERRRPSNLRLVIVELRWKMASTLEVKSLRLNGSDSLLQIVQINLEKE